MISTFFQHFFYICLNIYRERNFCVHKLLPVLLIDIIMFGGVMLLVLLAITSIEIEVDRFILDFF